MVGKQKLRYMKINFGEQRSKKKTWWKKKYIKITIIICKYRGRSNYMMRNKMEAPKKWKTSNKNSFNRRFNSWKAINEEIKLATSIKRLWKLHTYTNTPLQWNYYRGNEERRKKRKSVERLCTGSIISHTFIQSTLIY